MKISPLSGYHRWRERRREPSSVKWAMIHTPLHSAQRSGKTGMTQSTLTESATGGESDTCAWPPWNRDPMKPLRCFSASTGAQEGATASLTPG
jgi:hypothetical protein